jgi:hypothetical protein
VGGVALVALLNHGTVASEFAVEADVRSDRAKGRPNQGSAPRKKAAPRKAADKEPSPPAAG